MLCIESSFCDFIIFEGQQCLVLLYLVNVQYILSYAISINSIHRLYRETQVKKEREKYRSQTRQRYIVLAVLYTGRHKMCTLLQPTLFYWWNCHFPFITLMKIIFYFNLINALTAISLNTMRNTFLMNQNE